MEGLIVFTLNVKSDKPSGNKYNIYCSKYLAVLFHSKRSDGYKITFHLHFFRPEIYSL